MKKLLMTALIVAAPILYGPTVALAQDAGGSGHGDCDRYRGPTPGRPDCLGYNPFYNQSGGAVFELPTGSTRGQAVIRNDAVERRSARRAQ